MTGMNYYEVAPTNIIRSDSDVFTYSSDSLLSVGRIVVIEVGKKQMTGIVMTKTAKPTYPTKQIISAIYDVPIPIQLMKLTKWISKYYSSPLAIVLQTLLPRGIQKKRQLKVKDSEITKIERTNILLNKDQLSVIKELSCHSGGTFLLQGVTGSGKTEIYLDQAKKTIQNDKSVIVLVPEIALTSQLVSEFSRFFDNIIVTHSQMTEAERHIAWSEALNSSNPRVIIGPRSALFLPLEKIGLIVIDEAHEPSYKQEKSPKYSALRVATMLGRYHGATVIFGSATPNIIDRFLAETTNRPILMLPSVARKNSRAPAVTLIDMTKRDSFKKHRFLSNNLLEQIEGTLKDKKQTLIFHNRRGSASTVLCKSCGWTAQCPKCLLPLTPHMDKHQIQCHICGYKTRIISSCPDCGDAQIIFKGVGTKLIEAELKKLFPMANIARFDADNKTSETVNNRYNDLYNGTIDIAIGTQVVAKGLDLPNLRTVGVIQADTGLAIPDFNSTERTFQLLAQAVGRVGRNEHQTQIIVQSYLPNHPSVTYGIVQDYESFYKETLLQRKNSLFPPYIHLLKLTCIYKSEASAIKNAKKLADSLKIKMNKEVQILGPTPAFYEHIHNTYRWQLILKSPKREYLMKILPLIPTAHWQFELDPTSLL